MFINDSIWHHSVWTLSKPGNDKRCTWDYYLDGKLIKTYTSAGYTLPITLKSNFIGKSNWNDPFYNGTIDDFRVYQKQLKDYEVVALYNYVPPTDVFTSQIVGSQQAVSRFYSQAAASQAAGSQAAASQIVGSQQVVNRLYSQAAASQVAGSQAAASQVAASQQVVNRLYSQAAASQVAVSQAAASQYASTPAYASQQLYASQLAVLNASQAAASLAQRVLLTPDLLSSVVAWYDPSNVVLNNNSVINWKNKIKGTNLDLNNTNAVLRLFAYKP
jgi:hypothetical protein